MAYFTNTEEVATAIAKLEKLHKEFNAEATKFIAAGYDNVDAKTWSGKAVAAFKTCLDSVNEEVKTVLDRVQSTQGQLTGILQLVRNADAEFRTAYDTAQADLLTTAAEVTSLMPE